MSGATPSRLPRLSADELTPEQHALYRRITDGPRQKHAAFFPVGGDDGVLSGPYRAMLLSPVVGTALERVGVSVRYECDLPPNVRELAILIVAHHCRCAVEWRAHEALARSCGVPDATVDSLGCDAPDLTGDDVEVTYAFVRELLADNRVSDDTFARAVTLLSLTGVFELIATVGYYQFIAAVNNAFELSE